MGHVGAWRSVVRHTRLEIRLLLLLRVCAC
jgi:hypothetical protein